MTRQLIAIDTEYKANDDLNVIKKVFCIAACDESGQRFTKWFHNQRDKDILNEIARSFNAENPIFICHAFEKAERRALLHLGVDLNKYDFMDTFLIEKFLTSHVAPAPRAGLGIVAVTARYGLTQRDEEQKETMRGYCITDTTSGHEQEIMDYCFDDVRDLIPLFKMQLKKYRKAICRAYNVHRNEAMHTRFVPDNKQYWSLNDDECFYNIFIRHGEMLKGFGAIADRGIPVDASRIKYLISRINLAQHRREDELMGKYGNDLFKEKKNGERSENKKKIQELLAASLTPEQLEQYPKTGKTGDLSTTREDLEIYFKNTEGFGHDYYKHKCFLSAMGIVKDCPFERIDSNNRMKYESCCPWGAKTGRCTPQPSKGFVWGWGKHLWSVVQPADENTWLVELDFTSQETFLQAALCKDTACYEAYQSKDIYMYFLYRFGEIPEDDWNNLAAAELKEKYGEARSKIKSIILGTSYGMGAKKLAASAGTTLEKAQDMIKMINGVIAKTTEFKHQVYTACNEWDYVATDDFMLAELPMRNDSIYTTMKNFSFQSMGATILHWIVQELFVHADKYRAKVFSPVHDALWFTCKKGDIEAIRQIRDLMESYANHYSLAPFGWKIKIGAPEIIEKGDYFVGDASRLNKFLELWTDDLDERQAIIDQIQLQQERNKKYLINY